HELLDDVVEPRLRAREDALQALECAPRLRPHPARDEVAVGASASQPGGEQDSRRIDAHAGHEAAAALEGGLGQNISAIHFVLLRRRPVATKGARRARGGILRPRTRPVKVMIESSQEALMNRRNISRTAIVAFVLAALAACTSTTEQGTVGVERS